MAIEWQGKDKATWDAEINAWIFDDIQNEILQRLYPNSLYEYGEITDETEEDLYDLISPYQLVGEVRVYDTKLAWNDVLDDIEEYKTEQLHIIDQRFRILSLHDWKQSATDLSLFLNFYNFELFMGEIISNDLEMELGLIEVQDALLETEHDFQSGVTEKVARIDLGKRVIATINYMNQENNITVPQLTAVLTDVDLINIMGALNTGSLLTAQSLMAAKDLSGLAPMDQTYKDRVNGMINDYLGV